MKNTENEKEKNGYRYAALHLAEKGIIEQTVVYDGGVYTRRLSCYPELIICGAGHVAYALSQTAASVGFRETVIDDRKEFASPDRFEKGITVICDDFVHALKSIDHPYAWYAVMTRGHKNDEECVAEILGRSYMYLGMMGSHTKIAYTRQQLLNRGFTQKQIDTIHAPIGLAIGAQTPEEIAVSVTAELIQERAKLGCSYLDEDVYNLLRTDTRAMTTATIIKKEGSAPRGEGSCLAVTDSGTVAGTVGGGSVEAAVIKEASAVKDGTAPFIKEYGLSNSSAADLGMVCGGKVTVLFERV